jgi:hypothetical protein
VRATVQACVARKVGANPSFWAEAMLEGGELPYVPGGIPALMNAHMTARLSLIL